MGRRQALSAVSLGWSHLPRPVPQQVRQGPRRLEQGSDQRARLGIEVGEYINWKGELTCFLVS